VRAPSSHIAAVTVRGGLGLGDLAIASPSGDFLRRPDSVVPLRCLGPAGDEAGVLDRGPDGIGRGDVRGNGVRGRRTCGAFFAADFGLAVSGSDGGSGRKITRSLPMCWTGVASSSVQIRSSAASRAARSSLAMRTLINSCALRLTSISCSTEGVSPCWPTLTTGRSACARARKARRSAGVRVGMGQV